MKKVIKALIGISLICLAVYVCNMSHHIDTSKISKEDIIRLEATPELLPFDDLALQNPGHFLREVQLKLLEKGVIAQSPFGIIYTGAKYTMRIHIDSHGGRKDILMPILEILDEVRENGVTVKCYITNAQSFAFSFMLLGCDERIYVKGATVMQHKMYFNGGLITAASKVDDLKMAEKEAEAIGEDKYEWHELTRSGEKKEFTRKELEDLGIIDYVF